MPALESMAVRHSYGPVTALDGVSLRVEPGECLALVGESGSGKSTLLRCFNRMVVPTEGQIRIQGEDIRVLDPIRLRRQTGYVQQEGGLLPHWSVLRNVELVPRLQGMAGSRGLASEALDRVGLPAATYGARWPRELSGGQRQRVALARALAARPRVILLDEPFGALDAITRGELQAEFSSLRSELALTTVLVTHDLHEAITLADRVAVLRNGRLEQVGAPDLLAARPGSPYVARLLERARLAHG